MTWWGWFLVKTTVDSGYKWIWIMDVWWKMNNWNIYTCMQSSNWEQLVLVAFPYTSTEAHRYANLVVDDALAWTNRFTRAKRKKRAKRKFWLRWWEWRQCGVKWWSMISALPSPLLWTWHKPQRNPAQGVLPKQTHTFGNSYYLMVYTKYEIPDEQLEVNVNEEHQHWVGCTFSGCQLVSCTVATVQLFWIWWGCDILTNNVLSSYFPKLCLQSHHQH